LPGALDADVVIAGAGPAGAAAALTLRRYTNLSVTLLERSSFDEPRVGELASAGLSPLWTYLGLDADALLRGHVAARSPLAHWGASSMDFTGFVAAATHGWALDRRRFDRDLARAAQRAGARLVERAVVREVDGAPGAWSVRVERDGRSAQCAARVIVDATGPSARIARRIGAAFVDDDSLYAVMARFEDAGVALPGLIVEPAAEGWWYAVCVPDDVLVVTFLTDRANLRALHAAEAPAWFELLARTTHLRAIVPDRRPWSLDALFVPSRAAASAAGVGWFAAGDAALAADPLASFGIGFALWSGAHVARAAAGWLRGDPRGIDAYARGVATIFARYRARRREVYARERRWSRAPFWRSRIAGGKAEQRV
jgi:flavin-dependent dehydrogenase